MSGKTPMNLAPSSYNLIIIQGGENLIQMVDANEASDPTAQDCQRILNQIHGA